MPDALAEADYEAIETALRETERGRLFLAEHARRNRTAETRLLLRAIERLEGIIRERQGGDAATAPDSNAGTEPRDEVRGMEPDESAAPREPAPDTAAVVAAAAGFTASGAHPDTMHPDAARLDAMCLDATRLDALTSDEILTLFG